MLTLTVAWVKKARNTTPTARVQLGSSMMKLFDEPGGRLWVISGYADVATADKICGC